MFIRSVQDSCDFKVAAAWALRKLPATKFDYTNATLVDAAGKPKPGAINKKNGHLVLTSVAILAKTRKTAVHNCHTVFEKRRELAKKV